MAFTPSEYFLNYCQKRGWHLETSSHGDELRVPSPQINNFTPELPGKIGDKDYFFNILAYPYSSDERIEHAMWDLLGETIYKPSVDLAVQLSCSRKVSQNKKLGDIQIPTRLDEFPHLFFDRWDLLVSEPGCIYSNGPILYARFEKDNEAILATGFYDKEERRSYITSYGYPNEEILLLSPSALSKNPIQGVLEKELCMFNDRIAPHQYTLTLSSDPKKIIRGILNSFGRIVKDFRNGVYDSEHEEQYEFGETTESAIQFGESLTGKRSKLRGRADYDSSNN